MTDTQTAAITYLYNLIISDATMKTLIGDPGRLYPVWAKKDAIFPYIVHRLENAANIHPVFFNAIYYVDIWGYSSKLDTLFSIRDRLITLIDLWNTPMPAAGTRDIQGFRIWIDSDVDVPEDTEYISHRAMRFRIRYDRFREVVNIVSR